MIYFALTTLSTIGFGDFTPVSSLERSTAAFILLFGVAIFSFIMGQFIEILMNYKQLGEVGQHKDLSKWIALLTRFNNGNPLKKDLITNIEDFFDYYWEHNRMQALKSEADQRFMDELPYNVQGEIVIDYLWNDFLYRYRSYFHALKPLRENKLTEAFKTKELRGFIVDFVKILEPRFFTSSNDDVIQDQYEEVFEAIYVTKGVVGVGYRLFNQEFFGTQIIMNKKINTINVINDYSLIYEKCAEFLFKPFDFVEAYAMRKENFLGVMNQKYGKQMWKSIKYNYKYLIQEPLHEHREETALKF